GQRFDPSFTPTISWTDIDESMGGTFTDGVNMFIDLSEIADDTDPLTDGSTTITFNFSDAMLANGGANGVLVGGEILSVDGFPDPDTNAHGTITFRTIIQETYSDTYPSANRYVVEADILTNDATLSGDVIDNDDLVTPTVGTQFRAD